MAFTMSKKELMPLIDSTLLRPDVTEPDIIKLCEDAKKYNFASVCVNPLHIKLCKKNLKDAELKIRVGTVIGFPLGEDFTASKVQMAKDAFKAGADEIDFVICISAVKTGKWDYVRKEMQKIVAASKKKVVKAIIETGYLTKDEIKTVCELAVKEKIRYVKTATGFGPLKNDLETIGIMREAISNALRQRGDDMLPCEIKVSGGIRDYNTALMYAAAGVKRIGTSSASEIACHETEEEREQREAAFDRLTKTEPKPRTADKKQKNEEPQKEEVKIISEQKEDIIDELNQEIENVILKMEQDDQEENTESSPTDSQEQ